MSIDVLSELYEQVRVQPHSYVRDLHGHAADEITRLRAALDAMTAERDAALSVIRALLDADEHGQGIAWQDAMDRAHAALAPFTKGPSA